MVRAGVCRRGKWRGKESERLRVVYMRLDENESLSIIYMKLCCRIIELVAYIINGIKRQATRDDRIMTLD